MALCCRQLWNSILYPETRSRIHWKSVSNYWQSGPNDHLLDAMPLVYLCPDTHGKGDADLVSDSVCPCCSLPPSFEKYMCCTEETLASVPGRRPPRKRKCYFVACPGDGRAFLLLTSFSDGNCLAVSFSTLVVREDLEDYYPLQIYSNMG